MTRGTSPDSCCQCPSPSSEPLPTHASTGDPPTLACSFGSVSCGATAPFLWVCAHRVLFVPFKSGVSVFPVLWKPCNQILLGFKVRFPGDSQSLCWIPRLGSLMWCSEPSQQWENFFVIIVLPFVGHPPSRFGIWFYCDYAPPTISLKLLCLWTWGISFLVDSSILLSLFVQQLVVILVLLQEEMSTHPSTLPPWTRTPLIFVSWD